MFPAWFSSFASAPHRTRAANPNKDTASPRDTQHARTAASAAHRPPHTSLRPLFCLYQKTDTTTAPTPPLLPPPIATHVFTPLLRLRPKNRYRTAPARRDARPRSNETTPRPSSVANSRPLRSIPRSPPPHRHLPPDRPCLPTPILPRRNAPVPTAESFLSLPCRRSNQRSLRRAISPPQHKKIPVPSAGTERESYRLREVRPCADYSHSIVAGGLDEISYTTRLMPRTLLMISFDTRARKS